MKIKIYNGGKVGPYYQDLKMKLHNEIWQQM